MASLLKLSRCLPRIHLAGSLRSSGPSLSCALPTLLMCQTPLSPVHSTPLALPTSSTGQNCTSALTLSRHASTDVDAGSGHANVHWKWERYATVGLLGSVGMGFVYPSPLVDYSLAVLLPLHAHWGMEQIIIDYIHPPLLNKTVHALLYLLTFSTVTGLFYFNYVDVGICRAVAKLFTTLG